MNLIPGLLVTPPPKNAAISIKHENFCYPSKWVVRKNFPPAEFLTVTNCREDVNTNRTFFFTNIGKIAPFVWDERPFFYSTIVPVELISLFFSKLEDKIGIKTRVKFQLTDEPDLVAIFPGRFWGGVAARFGLLTCLVRSFCRIMSPEYKEVDWHGSIELWLDRMIDSYPYLSDTRNSVNNFIAGKTFVTDMIVSGDWHYWMQTGNRLEDPTQFTHEKYLSHVQRYVSGLWEIANKPKDKDGEIWEMAEKYAALNACR